MAVYSQALEDALKDINDSTETVLPLCNTIRATLHAILHEDVHFRNYQNDSLKLFECISDLERAALVVISGIEVIRRQNSDLQITNSEG